MKIVNLMRNSLHLMFWLDFHSYVSADIYDEFRTSVNHRKLENPNMQLLWETEHLLTELLDINRMYDNLQNTARFYTENLETKNNLDIQGSSQCFNDTRTFIVAVSQSKPWALKMLDAVGRPETGISTKQGEFVLLGKFDECLSTHASDFTGKYCRQKFQMPFSKNSLTGGQNRSLLNVGLCVPNSCSNSDVQFILELFLPDVYNSTLIPIEEECYPSERNYDTKAVIVFVIISFLTTIITVSTLYDVVIRHVTKPKKNLQVTHTNPESGSINVAYICDDSKDELASEMKNKLNDMMTTVHNLAIDEFESNKCTPGFCGNLMLSFSAYSNGEKLLNTYQSAGTLTSIHGIRFLTMTWIILAHTLLFGFYYAENAPPLYKKYVERISFMVILNADLAADTFFTVSGVLLTYTVLKHMTSQKGKINWLYFYFHRFWRFTPTYMFVLMVYLCLFPYISNGPLWIIKDMDNCTNGWWYNLLYINNFQNLNDQCFGWSWFLANLMQFYIISPVVIIPMFYSKIVGTVFTTVLLFASFTTTGIISKVFQFDSVITSGDRDYFNQYYMRPYCRIGPYILGMYCGFILHNTNRTCKINKYINVLIWLALGTIAGLVLYGMHNSINGHHLSIDTIATYNTIYRTVWGAAVCWVIFACSTGNGGFINSVLSWKGFITPSSLTYSVYLIHPIIMLYLFITRNNAIRLDSQQIVLNYLGIMLISYCCAFLTSLAIELPMIKIEKVLLRRFRRL